MYKKVQNLLMENQLEAILIMDPYNIRYLSGFTGSAGILYITRNRQVILTDFRYVEQVRAECMDFLCVDVKGSSYVEAVNMLLEEDKIALLGFEDEYISLKEYNNYVKNGRQKELVPIGNQVNRLRYQKEEWEIEKLAKAEHIGDLAFSHILTVIRPGVTELDIASELEYFMKKSGASKTSFDTIAASGVNSALPHANPTSKKLQHGDFLTMDFGCIYDGYCSDMTRTVVVGKASDKQKEIYNIVRQAQEAALEFVKAERKGSEVDKIARDIIKESGYGSYFGHGLGHSVGLFIHEEPRFSPKCHEMIQSNMIMTVEPGIYLPDFGGVRIEDMIVIKENGYLNLTHSSKELIEL